MLKVLCLKKGYFYIDSCNIFTTFLADGLHLNEGGKLLMDNNSIIRILNQYIFKYNI